MSDREGEDKNHVALSYCERDWRRGGDLSDLHDMASVRSSGSHFGVAVSSSTVYTHPSSSDRVDRSSFLLFYLRSKITSIRLFVGPASRGGIESLTTSTGKPWCSDGDRFSGSTSYRRGSMSISAF